jgi:hypothetical protein
MTLVGHSPDLAKLVEDGYDVEIRDGNLLVHHIPYVNAEGAADYCVLVSDLSVSGDTTIAPGRHEVWVVGDVPRDHQGQKISIIADEDRLDYGNGLVTSCRLSGKLHGQMPANYYEKITNYVNVLGIYARAVDPTITHLNFPARETSEDESVFRYHDAATSRAGLSAVSGKLRVGKVAIIGLGGTGSYILDLIAKTPIAEIHLFDDDVLYAHNAFRAPGAASLDQLRETPYKVEHFAAQYDPIRRGIVAHPVRIDSENIEQLRELDFVFLSMDAGPTKRVVIEHLVDWGIAFIDSAMGVQRQENALRGTLRVTAGGPEHYDHLPHRISYSDVNADEYDWNIQTADLNMMNAAMAVLMWKKSLGYYIDDRRELNATFVVAKNKIVGGDPIG